MILINIIIVSLIAILGYVCYQVISISKMIPVVGTYYCGPESSKEYNKKHYETKIILSKNKKYSIEGKEKGEYKIVSIDDDQKSGRIVYDLKTSSQKKETNYELFIDKKGKTSGYMNKKTQDKIFCTKES